MTVSQFCDLAMIQLYVCNQFLYNSQIRIAYQHKICKFVKLCYQQFIYKYLYYFLNIQERSGNQQVQVQNFNFGPCLMFVELLDSNFNKKYGKIQKWTDKLQNVLLCYCMINSSKQVLLIGRYIRANEQSSNQKWDKSPSTIKMRLMLQSYRNIKRFSFTHLSSAWNTVLWLYFTIRRVGSKLAVILKSPRKFDIKKTVEIAICT